MGIGKERNFIEMLSIVLTKRYTVHT